MSSRKKTDLKAVTKKKPCAVCGGDHKCSRGADGLLVCGRMSGPQPGFVALGVCTKDPQFSLYRATEGIDPPVVVMRSKGKFRPTVPDPAPPPVDDGPGEWDERAAGYAAQLTPQSRGWLADALRLPVGVFDSLPGFGANLDAKLWTFPERDAAGRVIGILTRDMAGKKKAMRGGKRGLHIVTGWLERPGPVYAVEGPTDLLAMTAAGLAAVGRPSNTGGGELLAELLMTLPADRQVVVIGENDRRGTRWPGRDGAERVGAVLAERLGRDILIAYPPDGAKDVRHWLTHGSREAIAWPDRGPALVAALQPESFVPPTAGGSDGGETPPPGAEAQQKPKKVAIRVGTDEDRVNAEAVAALGRAEGTYQRGGLLVDTVVLDAPSDAAADVLRDAGSVVVRPLPLPQVRDRMCRAVDWFTLKERDGAMVPELTHPPAWCVAAVHTSGCWPSVRRLTAVVSHPALLGSGEIVTAPGYHRASGLFLQPTAGGAVVIADVPTAADAAAAVAVLLEVVADFPFERAEYRAAWLAALLTPLCRFAFEGPAPFFLFDGNIRGCGKGLLADVIALVLYGRRFPVMHYPKDDEAELRKRVTSLAAEAEQAVLLDNLSGSVGDPVLDMVLTATRWKDRILGGNTTYDGPLYVTWFGTGNNIQLAADTGRRTLPVRLESSHESPEDRDGFRHQNLRLFVRENRARLLAAAVTAIRAWVVAGRPGGGLKPWGSFEGWSGVVRAVVVFAGLPDPCLARLTINTTKDVERVGLGQFLRLLRQLDPNGRGLTARQILERANPDGCAIIAEWAGEATAQKLGYKLRGSQRRLVDGLFLDKRGEAGAGVRYVTLPADLFNSDGNRGDDGDNGDAAPRGPIQYDPSQMLPD